MKTDIKKLIQLKDMLNHTNDDKEKRLLKRVYDMNYDRLVEKLKGQIEVDWENNPKSI